MDTTPDDAVVAEDTIHLSGEEGERDTLMSNTPHRPDNRIQSKQCSLVWSVSLFICPYVFCVLFLAVFAVVTYFCFMLAPVVAVLNALPATNSVLIDLEAVTPSLYPHANGNVTVQESTFQYSYSTFNYLFNLAPAPYFECSLNFYSCEKEKEEEYYELCELSSGCIAYLSGNSHDLFNDTIQEINSAPQMYVSDKFIGVSINNTHCSASQQNTPSLCKYNCTSREETPSHPVPTGLFRVSEAIKVSLPHYSHDACHKIYPKDCIPGDSNLLIESTNSLADCYVIVSTAREWTVFKSFCVHFLVSAVFILLSLIAFDLLGCLFKRFSRKKIE